MRDAAALAPVSDPPLLIQSRLRPPLPLLALVRREELLRRLSATRAPLVVVTAPGGYGKTVTLAQWAENDGVPFAWLQADDSDNDPLVFLQYLTAALQGVANVDPLVEQWLQRGPPPVETRILPALAAAVTSAAPFVLVVDDVHLVTSEACWRLLGLLVDQLPPGAHVCLSGRKPAPLPLSRMRAAGRLLELGPAELALSTDETLDLLALRGVSADREAAASLAGVTEGWVAGISLAALAGDHDPSGAVFAGIHGDRRDIARYLTSEVLEQQPTDIAGFLVQTSILERFSSSLCRAVTEDAAAGELLRRVAGSDLFVNSLDDTGTWFRYHHLFAEFLQAELVSRRGEEEAAALHRRAAAWFEEHGDLEEAVRHWLAGGEPGPAGAIVCRCHMSYAHLARYQTLRRWLDMFSDEQILADPALTLAAGGIGSMAADSPRARAWIDAALRGDVGDGMWPGIPVPLRAMQAFMRAALARDGIDRMHAESRIAVELSGEAPASMRAAVLAQLGIASWLSGDATAALGYLEEGEAKGVVGNVLARMTALGYQALIFIEEGRWSEARTKTAEGLRLYDEAGLTIGIPIFASLLARALIESHDRDPAACERIPPIAAFAGQSTTAPFMALLCEIVFGEVLLAAGDEARAEGWARAGFTRLATMPDAGILRERLNRLRERLEERRLAEPLTPAERRILELLPTELSQREIAERLFVSRETVRTHTRDIYRKLEVHSRSRAVARAREVGLLGSS